jgi:hypothetical protein
VCRKPFVDKRVVCAEQVEHAAVCAHEVVEEQLCLAPHGRAQLLVEVSVLADVREHFVQILEAQPLTAKPGGERLRARIRQHATHLSLELAWIGEPPGAGLRQQLLIRQRRPEEEGQPRGQRDVADGEAFTCLDVGRYALEAEHEVRARQDRFECGAHASFEALRRSRHVVQRQQLLQVLVRERTAVGLHGE